MDVRGLSMYAPSDVHSYLTEALRRPSVIIWRRIIIIQHYYYLQWTLKKNYFNKFKYFEQAHTHTNRYSHRHRLNSENSRKKIISWFGDVAKHSLKCTQALPGRTNRIISFIYTRVIIYLHKESPTHMLSTINNNATRMSLPRCGRIRLDAALLCSSHYSTSIHIEEDIHCIWELPYNFHLN